MSFRSFVAGARLRRSTRWCCAGEMVRGVPMSDAARVGIAATLLVGASVIAGNCVAADKDSPEASVPQIPVVAGAIEPVSPAEWYGAGVRPTEARTPEEELAGFHVAPGFEVRLFAAEPEVAKPMNMAMDVRGRLWVTDSFEYPYPAPQDRAAGDAVRILEDIDGDGRADKSTVFADHLNIPIGVLPYGEGCICFSIPNLYYLRDTDGDGVCDQRDKILGPFDTTRDTHGMINSLRMGLDGWIYANHGFNNQSKVAGADGHEISMSSGNSFRFRPDGSRVEHITWGQVNPFGRAEDDWGYSYSADCHSKPVSQLIRDGYYPSFGRPDDGLGFIPPMMEHLHGSTAISGLVFLSPTLGIESLNQQVLSGNVMTSRINRNYVEYQGTTAIARELPDFLTSDDPWFRPVDIRLGSDGYLYVADFYNRIIGHYEVPLEHPGRDRYRGRIWQIRPSDGTQLGRINFSEIEDIVSQWSNVNATARQLAFEESLRRASPAIDRAARHRGLSNASPQARVLAMWYLLRRAQLNPNDANLLANDPSPLVRTQWMKVLGSEDLPTSLKTVRAEFALRGLSDENVHVVRAAAESMGRNGDARSLAELLKRLSRVDAADVVLQQSLRIAMRNILRDHASLLDSLSPSSMLGDSEEEKASTASSLASIALAIQTPAAGRYLAQYLKTMVDIEPRSLELLKHAITCLPEDQVEPVIASARRLAKLPGVDERSVMSLIAVAMKESALKSEPLRQWAREVAQQNLAVLEHGLQSSTPLDLHWADSQGRIWPVQDRPTSEGVAIPVFSSFPLGESYTGSFSSEPFIAPQEISFWLAGHNGQPDTAERASNVLELVDVGSGKIVKSALPPRRDPVIRVTWDCKDIAGTSVRLVCRDGDATTAYAWLAFGGFEPAWLNPRAGDHPLQNAMAIITEFRLVEFSDALGPLLMSRQWSTSQRAAVGQTLAQLQQRPLLDVLFQQIAEAVNQEIPASWCEAVLQNSPLNEREEIALLSRQLTQQGQLSLALRLAGNRELLEVLLETMDAGALTPQVLLDKEVENRVIALASSQQREQIEHLKSLAKPMDAAVDAAIAEVLAEVAAARSDRERGQAVFKQHCAVCHQLKGEGQVVGPQLDGVGGRGAARLMEDIGLPDRNVDRAFRTTTFITVDGRVINGLVRSEDDSKVVIVGNDGKSQEIEVDEIDVRREGTTSLMPGNFHQTLKRSELADLVTFLLSSISK